MPALTITEAAKYYKINRSTLYRYMDDGILSFDTMANGKRSLQPAEIERVFPIRPKTSQENESQQSDTPVIQALETRLKMLLDIVARLERDKEHLAEDKADLRRRLDDAEQERRSMIRLLEDKRPKSVRWWMVWKRAA